MIDLMQATQDAVYAALAASVTGAPVLQHLREGQKPPFVRLFSLTSENEAAKGDQAEQITIEVHVVTEGEENGPLLTFMHQARAALDGQPLVSEVASFFMPTLVTAAAGGPADDGVTYAGVLTFTVYAQPL